MIALYHEIVKHLEAHTPLVMATIMEQEGSTPRTAGSKMLILPDASIVGTIGGGLYEAQSIASGLELHTNLSVDHGPAHKGHKGRLLSFNLQGSDFPADMDMICGGALLVLLECIPDTPQSHAHYAAACTFAAQGENFVDIAHIRPTATQTLVRVERTLLLPAHQRTLPSKHDLPAHIVQNAEAWQEARPHSCSHLGEEYLFEYVAQPFQVHIFGAGHVALELARLTTHLNFVTHVLDDRAEFANAARFPQARTQVLPALDQATVQNWLAQQALGPHSGIVIVTRGHARDREVLHAALLNPGGGRAGYIGMIGSKSKRQGVYERLRQQGFDQDDIARVHSPIGLPIGADSPQEIAVSIAAELIQWRAGQTAIANSTTKAAGANA